MKSVNGDQPLVETQSANRPLVSILMPVYNGGRFLQGALDSVTSQHHSNLEIVMVDDGSTDNTRQIMEGFRRSFDGLATILTHENGENRGIAASYRLGLASCRGKYVAFLEHDDRWEGGRILSCVAKLEEMTDVGVVFSRVKACDTEGEFRGYPNSGWINRPPRNCPFPAFWRLLWGNFALTFSNLVIRRAIIQEEDVVLKPEGFQDWMLLLSLSKSCLFYYDTRSCIQWRLSHESHHARLRKTSVYGWQRQVARFKGVCRCARRCNT